MDELLGAVQQIDPLWSVVLVAIALALLLGARLWGASFGRVLAGLVALALVTAIAGGWYYGYRHLEDTRRLAERRALDERATSLFQQSIQPGSAFACIDGSPVTSVLDACELNLFAEPQRVAAAVAIVTQRIGFLVDALGFAKERDPSYFERIETMRKSLESDPYGFVAFALSVEHGCTVEACKRFDLLRDPARVRENMRVRRLEAFMARYSTGWKEPGVKPAEATVTAPAASAAKIAPLVTISEPVAPASAAKVAPLVTISEPMAPPAPSEPAQAEARSSPGVTISLSDTISAANPGMPQAPAAASAPAITPPAQAGFNEPARATSASSAPTNTKEANAPAPGPASATAAKSPPPRPAPQAKAKAKADPVARRTNEPVVGLPRIVPRD